MTSSCSAAAPPDRRSSAGEPRPLADLGVLSLSLGYEVQLRRDDRGNWEKERAAFTWRGEDGVRHEGAVIDVSLSVHEPAVVVAAARGYIRPECPTEEASLLRWLGVTL